MDDMWAILCLKLIFGAGLPIAIMLGVISISLQKIADELKRMNDLKEEERP